jgi:hypothetical protein
VRESKVNEATAVADLDHFGLAQHFDVGLRLTVSTERLPSLVASLDSSLTGHPFATARLVGFGLRRSDVDLTLAISLGTTQDVVAATDSAQAGVALLAHLVTELADFLPALRELPAPTSDEALVASALRDGELLGSLPVEVEAPTRALVSAIG